MRFRKWLIFSGFGIWLLSGSLFLPGCSAGKRLNESPTSALTAVNTSTATPTTKVVVETLATSTPLPSPTPTVEQSISHTDLLVVSAERAAQLQEIVRWHDRSAVNSIAFSPQADFIVWGNQEGQVVLVRLDEKLSPAAAEQPRVQWVAHVQRINSLELSPSGSLLATGSEDYTAKLWNLEDEQVKKVFKGYEDGIAALAFSADEKWLAVSSYDFKVHLWKTQAEGAARDFSTKNTFAQGIAFSRDGKMLAVSANEWKASLFSVQLWQVINGKLIHKISGFQERLNGVAFSPQEIGGSWQRR
jgi:WD40 repeat protein